MPTIHKQGNYTIEKYTPLDGEFYLIVDSSDKLIAKTWTVEDADRIASALSVYKPYRRA